MVKAKKIIKKKTKQRKEKKSRPPRIFIDRNGKPYVKVGNKKVHLNTDKGMTNKQLVNIVIGNLKNKV